MPTTAAQRLAFMRRVRELIKDATALSDDSVRDALRLLERARQDVATELSRRPPSSFGAQHLRDLRAAMDREVAEMVREYQRTLPDLLERAHELGIDMAQEPLAAAGRRLVGFVPRTTLAILKEYSADLVQNLGAEALRKINAVLAQAALGTVSAHDAIQRIAGELPGRSVFKTLEGRAEAIFRTEVGRAVSAAHQARMNQLAEELPGIRKEWVTAGDARVRPAHYEAAGQIVGAKARFSVGGYSAAFPRDPALPASQSVNCRCWSVPHLDDETLASGGLAA